MRGGIKRRLWYWFTIGVLLSSCTSGVFAASPESLARQLRTAEAARSAGDLAVAYRILHRLLLEHPGDEGVNLAYGLTVLAQGNASQAELAFERVLQINPENQRARLEMARAFVANRRYREAQLALQTVLASNPPPAVRENVQAFLARVRALEERSTKKFSGQIEVGAFFDSNVNVGPNVDEILIRPVFFGPVTIDTLVVGPESQPTEDAGISLSGLGRYARRMGRSEWHADMSVYGFVNRMIEETEYDLAYYQLGTTFLRDYSGHKLMIPVRFSQIFRGGEQLLLSVGSGAVYSYLFPESGQRVGIRSDIRWQDYADRTDRDGLYWLAGLSLDQFLGVRRQHQAGIGIAYYQELADADIYAKYGFRLGLNTRFRLAAGLSLYATLQYQKDDYQAQEPLAPQLRVDKQFQVVAGLRKRLRERMHVDFNHQFTQNESEFDLYDYDRNVSTISLVCGF